MRVRATPIESQCAGFYQCSRKTGAIAASAAAHCKARMGTACRGDCGSHLKVRKTKAVASAPTDMTSGR